MLCLFLAAASKAFADYRDRDCSREIKINEPPINSPQDWIVKKNFRLPEGKTSLAFINGKVVTTLDEKAPSYCLLNAKAAHPNPREFRKAPGLNRVADGKEIPIPPRTIHILKGETGKKYETKTDYCDPISCSKLVAKYGGSGYALKSQQCTAYAKTPTQKACLRMDLVFEKAMADPTALEFSVSNDKTISNIVCKNVKTYDQLISAFGDYIKGVKCPMIKVDEASAPSKKAVDEDVAIKPGITGDATSDASESKKTTPSGQTTN